MKAGGTEVSDSTPRFHVTREGVRLGVKNSGFFVPLDGGMPEPTFESYPYPYPSLNLSDFEVD
jgi:hypothetical protein